MIIIYYDYYYYVYYTLKCHLTALWNAAIVHLTVIILFPQILKSVHYYLVKKLNSRSVTITHKICYCLYLHIAFPGADL